MEQTEKRKKRERREQTPGRKRAAFFARALCFFVILAILATYAMYVLTPKYDYGICSIMNLYRQPKNSVDVLVVGTSLAYAGVNTNVLWQEYGIACYDLCGAELPFWTTYYLLREALKIQRPQLILLDAKAAVYTKEYSSHARTILSTFGILSPENRWGAIYACLKEKKDALNYILGLPAVHNRYTDVEAKDFIAPPDNGERGETWKGFIEVDEKSEEELFRPTLTWNNVKQNITGNGETYVRKILALAQQEGIPLRIIAFPNPDYANDHKYYNKLWEIAGEYGVPYTNYNHYEDKSVRFGLRYSSDFADWQHLNVKGGIKFSVKLGQDLLELYDLPDRRGDPAYASYDACAEQWFRKLPTFETAPENLEEAAGNK